MYADYDNGTQLEWGDLQFENLGYSVRFDFDDQHRLLGLKSKRAWLENGAFVIDIYKSTCWDASWT